MRDLGKKAILFVLVLAMLLTSGSIGIQEVYAEDVSTGIHDIFVAKDDSKLELFKARVLNRILYHDVEIDVSDIDIAPNEIEYVYGTTRLTGEMAARAIVRDNPFHSTASTTGVPVFTYKENGCVSTVKYTYNYAWTQDVVERAIAGYDEAVALIQPGDSDFAKILKFHDWVVKNVSYGMSKAYSDFAIGALANRSAVCAGYTQCYGFLPSQSGVDNIYVAARTVQGQHAWNLVKLEEHWFHVDCTWDRGLGINPNVNHTYFMLSDDEFNADGAHTEDWKDPEKGYPTNNACTIENKFYKDNKDMAIDAQIAANPIVLKHKYDASSIYSSSGTEHWRTCAAGVTVREQHTGNPCTVCGHQSAAADLTVTFDPKNGDSVFTQTIHCAPWGIAPTAITLAQPIRWGMLLQACSSVIPLSINHKSFTNRF